jgi:hypothetical protein
MNSIPKSAACTIMLGAAGFGVFQHASFCPYAPTSRPLCVAPPPEHIHGNHNHSPSVPLGGLVITAISTSSGSSITPPGGLVR